MTRRLPVSIVVCTRNRARSLSGTLAYYERIAAEVAWELIVVDNGSTDETSDILQCFSTTTRITFRFITEPRPGASRGRNLGYRHAEGQIIAFTDDDCYPRADFVDALQVSFSTAAIDYLGGRILLFDPNDYPVTIQTSKIRRVFAPGTFISAGLIHGANMAVRREVMAKIGGFDERLGPGTPFPCEDVDLLTRASFAGFTGVYDPRPVIYHHHQRQSLEQVRTLKRLYDHGRGAYYAKGLLNPVQRRKASGVWLRSVCRRVFRVGRPARSNWMILFHELQGAVSYLWMRARDGGSSQPADRGLTVQ
jgi:glycosyltransferase involved in cell wall biosynthesis